MRKYILSIAAVLLLTISIIGTGWKAVDNPQKLAQSLNKIDTDSLYNDFISDIYQEAHLDSAGLSETVFEKAITGFYNMKYSGLIHDKSTLTIADFDLESSRKRLFIIDLAQKKLILNTWVAHGQNSGGDKPSNFSNTINSNQSSLGFYLTGEIYFGKHGRSLKLDGMDEGFNSNARERAIVIHGAAYVCQESINQLGRLGRSQGCPAVAKNLSDRVINAISDKTVFFINNSDQQYTSTFLNETLAASMALKHEQVLAAKFD